ncbi:MAG TPA: hypothetical protein DCS28_02180 [Candidatus Moranbacteria bacterium]|nr:hypothetical protein [Candidatus Moranbacteria bacterium]HAT74822.1 hypothetical protein [Candidatus Moranbacteria bacterium]
MASPVSHIVYAKKYFDSLENGKINSDFSDEEKMNNARKINKDEFILGAVFPDIRVIEPNIKRADLHLKFEPLTLDFSGLASFEAGWKFHLYCDMRREEILNNKKFYNLKNTAELFGRPAKFTEDELVYEEYNNWEKLAYYFRNPPVIDLGGSIDRQTIVLWYAILAKYIEEKVTIKTTRIFLSKHIKLTPKVDEIINAVLKLRENAAAVKILLTVKDEIVNIG